MTTFFSCVRIFWFSLRLRVQIFIMTVIIKCGSQSAIDGGDWVRPISAERAKGLVAVRSVRGQKQDARRSRSPGRLMVIKWPRWLTEYPLKCRPNPCSATKRNLSGRALKVLRCRRLQAPFMGVMGTGSQGAEAGCYAVQSGSSNNRR